MTQKEIKLADKILDEAIAASPDERSGLINDYRNILSAAYARREAESLPVAPSGEAENL